MKLLWVMIMLLGTAGSLRAQQPAGNAKLPDVFRDLLAPGAWVTLSDRNQGFELRLYGQQPDTQAAAASNVEVRFAQLQVELARSNLEKALNANQRTAAAVPQDEVQQLRLALQRAELQLEMASDQAQISVYRVVGVKEDYVALESDNAEMYIPLAQIRGVARQKGAAASSAKPRATGPANQETKKQP